MTSKIIILASKWVKYLLANFMYKGVCWDISMPSNYYPFPPNQAQNQPGISIRVKHMEVKILFSLLIIPIKENMSYNEC